MKQFFTRMGIVWLSGVCLMIWGCKPNLVAPELSLGDLDMSAFRALGDGFTAGFADTDFREPGSTLGLYALAQQHAFPALMAQQFSEVPQAQVPYEAALVSEKGSGHLLLSAIAGPICTYLDPETSLEQEAPDNNWQEPYTGQMPHNLGIPLLRLTEVDADSTSQQNLFLNRLNSYQLPNYLEVVRASAPSFFTCWLGTRDLLDFAIRGGANADYTPLSPKAFGEHVAEILSTATEGRVATVKGLVATVPDITRFPYFTSVKPLYYSQENCAGATRPIFIERHTGGVKEASFEDRILLPAKAILGVDDGNGPMGLSPGNPIPHIWVLDQEEVKELQALIGAYNAAVDSVVRISNERLGEPRLKLVALHEVFRDLTFGYIEDGLEVSSQYLEGGIFSLDGLYLTPRGHALVANAFIQALNEHIAYRAKISPLRITDFPGVVYP